MAQDLLQRRKARQAREVWQGVLSMMGRPRTLAQRLARFKILVDLRRYEEAFREGELILDADKHPDTIEALAWPWSISPPFKRNPLMSFKRDISLFKRLALANSKTPWARFYWGYLLSRCGDPSWKPHLARITRFPPKRYGWMRYELGLKFLRGMEFHAAVKTFGIVADSTQPSSWRALGFQGEAYLCLGRLRQAWLAFDRAQAAAPEYERGNVLAWKGEMLLWVGDYKKALAALDEAVRARAIFAHCWRGAAKLQLGLLRESLEDLDQGLRDYPRDLEAYVWRGECKRRLGLYREALEDLNIEPLRKVYRGALAIPSHRRLRQESSKGDDKWVWNLFNRALVQAALGDEAAMRRDFDAIPPRIIGFLKDKSGLRVTERPSCLEMRAVLEEGLRLARGYRRPEEYGNVIWMK